MERPSCRSSLLGVFTAVPPSYVSPTGGTGPIFHHLDCIGHQTECCALSVEHVDIAQGTEVLDLFDNALRQNRWDSPW